jgi:hypothetical protein
MSRTIVRNRYNHPVDIPPLQWTQRGYVRVTPRGIQPPRPLRQEIRLPRPTVWLSAFAWGSLNVLAFALIVASVAMLALAFSNIW